MIIHTLYIFWIAILICFAFSLCSYLCIISKFGHEYFLRRIIIKLLKEHHASFTEISESKFLGLTQCSDTDNFKLNYPKGKVLFFKWDQKIKKVDLQKLLIYSLRKKGYECSLIRNHESKFGEFKVEGKFLKYFIGIIEGKCIFNSFFIRIEFQN